MDEQLQRLKSLSNSLNQLADKTTQRLLEIEEFLSKDCNLGISATYTLEDGSFNYGRIEHKGPFVLYHLDPQGKTTRIQNLKREQRFEFLTKLPHLLKLLENRILEQIERLGNYNVS